MEYRYKICEMEVAKKDQFLREIIFYKYSEDELANELIKMKDELEPLADEIIKLAIV